MVTRPKVYQSYVPPAEGRRYRITENSDGTVSISDVTEYLIDGDPWTAADGNNIWDQLESNEAEKGAPNGLATLGPDGKVPETQLPEIGVITSGTEIYIDKQTPLESGVLYCMY